VRSEIVLETEDLTKEFAGFVAVRAVNLRVVRGTIHALIGPNGPIHGWVKSRGGGVSLYGLPEHVDNVRRGGMWCVARSSSKPRT